MSRQNGNTKIANQLVAYCSKADWEGAYITLYSEKEISLEPDNGPSFEKETIGVDAVRAKAKLFDKMLEKVFLIQVTEPLIAGNTIAFTIKVDAIRKDME